MTIKVLLVDDHEVVRQGLRMYLELDDTLEVVGEGKNGQEALDLVSQLKPDVVVMDLLMPVLDGVSAIRQLKNQWPDLEILALTSALEDHMISGAMEAGATGYLLKDISSDNLIEAIHAASRGEVRLHPEAAKRLVQEVHIPNSHETLTPRETEIIKLVAKGLSNKNIARELGISEPTIKAHLSSILSKTGLQTRTQAALFALKQGLIGLESI